MTVLRVGLKGVELYVQRRTNGSNHWIGGVTNEDNLCTMVTNERYAG